MILAIVGRGGGVHTLLGNILDNVDILMYVFVCTCYSNCYVFFFLIEEWFVNIYFCDFWPTGLINNLN